MFDTIIDPRNLDFFTFFHSTYVSRIPSLAVKMIMPDSVKREGGTYVNGYQYLWYSGGPWEIEVSGA